MTIPLARLHIWTCAANERQGARGPTPATLDVLDEIAAAGGVEAFLEKHGE